MEGAGTEEGEGEESLREDVRQITDKTSLET